MKGPIDSNLIRLYVGSLLILLVSCKAFMHGYTWNKAQNAYYLVTGNDSDFGNKRLAYNKGFHKNSELANFLNCACNQRGQPSFIFEYMSGSKRRGIKLFYPTIDSVFIFEEPSKNKLRSVMKDSRQMDQYERMTYQRMLEGK